MGIAIGIGLYVLCATIYYVYQVRHWQRTKLIPSKWEAYLILAISGNLFKRCSPQCIFLYGNKPLLNRQFQSEGLSSMKEDSNTEREREKSFCSQIPKKSKYSIIYSFCKLHLRKYTS